MTWGDRQNGSGKEDDLPVYGIPAGPLRLRGDPGACVGAELVQDSDWKQGLGHPGILQYRRTLFGVCILHADGGSVPGTGKGYVPGEHAEAYRADTSHPRHMDHSLRYPVYCDGGWGRRVFYPSSGEASRASLVSADAGEPVSVDADS